MSTHRHLQTCSCYVLVPVMSEKPVDYWLDTRTNTSRLMATRWDARYLINSAKASLPFTKQPGSYLRLEAVKKAIDEYAECEFGNREYFWGRPHKAG
jgi:hypothetical protein